MTNLITFSTSDLEAIDMFPPVPAGKIIPEWYKDTPIEIPEIEPYTKPHTPTIKRCVPVLDYMTTGYVIRATYEIQVKEYVDENKLMIDDFKKYVKIFIDVDKYVEKSKKGSIEFIGFKFKQILLVSEHIEIKMDIPNVVQNKKKVINKTINQPKLVIDEVIDKSIIEHYITTDDDIMKISKDKNIMVWQIVSVLINNKIMEEINIFDENLFIQVEKLME
jgi:hypothetical protein